ncbi:MAG: hypothetical protein QGI83_24750 [Candidatus Latescibacteria bacterium]|nr:hypothetical protein [Candidatus Latescibacterota bacterium]
MGSPRRELHVLFTMDVEPATTESGTSGPASAEAGMRSTQDYQDVLRSWGYCATYFVHPEVAMAKPEFLDALAEDGATLGLHLHTTKFAAAPQVCELGGLTAGEQRDVILEATEIFETGMGFRPTLFRPGCFSASDATYGVLVELGFTGGGVSIPGRIWPERYCVWSGAYPYAHQANEAFRLMEGELPFVDIPLSVDLTVPLCWNPLGFHHYPDLRPGGMYSDEEEVEHDRCAMLHNVLGRMAGDDPPLKTLVVDVHNDRDFTSEDSQAAAHLRSLLEGIESECHELGWRPVASTYDVVIRHYMEMQEDPGNA